MPLSAELKPSSHLRKTKKNLTVRRSYKIKCAAESCVLTTGFFLKDTAVFI